MTGGGCHARHASSVSIAALPGQARLDIHLDTDCLAASASVGGYAMPGSPPRPQRLPRAQAAGGPHVRVQQAGETGAAHPIPLSVSLSSLVQVYNESEAVTLTFGLTLQQIIDVVSQQTN